MDIKILLDIFEKMCLVNYFEIKVIDAIRAKKIICPVYLSLGQESIASTLSAIVPHCQIFPQHRAASFYLSFGGDPILLRDELLGLKTGIFNGRMGSNAGCFLPDVDIYSHNGLIGENVPIAVGAALGNGHKTIAVFGDGSAEEDYLYPAIGFAATHNLPVMFLCQDNNLAILTPVDIRRNWKVTDMAKSMGVVTVDVDDDPILMFQLFSEWDGKNPLFINCHTCRKQWHVGCGVDGPPKWDRFQLYKDYLISQGCNTMVSETEDLIKKDMEVLWNDIS